MVCPECAAAGSSSRRRPAKGAALLAAGVVAMTLVAVTVVVLGRGDGAQPAAVAAGRPGAGPGDGPVRAIPTRITPTEFPTEEETEPESSGPSTSRTPTPTRLPTPSARPSASRPPTYESWAGPGCAGGGEYREYGRYADGLDGWYTVTRGGYRGGGCDGRFTALPMSGSATEDHDNAATWTWHVGAPSTRCALAVHVPSPPRPQDAAGDPSVYQVLADGVPYATFSVDQTAHHGRLLTTAAYPLRGDTFTVRLVDRGRDWGSAEWEGAHHGAGQMRLTCR
ncbi:adhesin [Streptomyces solicathayae]|uniref:Adhesin n=1 Tax=Streptomyces solicathayae TaxID=3081768 RepID=A0ABZ0LWG5_9ACTN|nr:adhesin [Streptomyces sp. HUAS YS2]WOX23829.1 adhesin [Streptomyces sp. HUAS YS2]